MGLNIIPAFDRWAVNSVDLYVEVLAAIRLLSPEPDLPTELRIYGIASTRWFAQEGGTASVFVSRNYCVADLLCVFSTLRRGRVKPRGGLC